jgi:hypothetical protein
MAAQSDQSAAVFLLDEVELMLPCEASLLGSEGRVSNTSGRAVPPQKNNATGFARTAT